MALETGNVRGRVSKSCPGRTDVAEHVPRTRLFQVGSNISVQSIGTCIIEAARYAISSMTSVMWLLFAGVKFISCTC